MYNIKHFSFDLWFTLIKSNPDFKKERSLYFYKNFNDHKKTISEVETIFRNVDLICNAINEKTGRNIDAEEMYLMVIYQLNNSLELKKGIDLNLLYKDMEALIFKFGPTIFTPQTYDCLDKIKHKSNTTINILSNTAFIKGSTLRTIMDNLSLSQYFDFQIYSDEVGVSKPCTRMYQILLENIYKVRKSEDIALHEIMHIGDNPIADIQGATAAGMRAFQINTNGQFITNLLN